jgi:drug/metabolite transporter (DMT)-like permease
MSETGTYARLTGVSLLWGGTFIAARVAAPVLPHFTLAALRFWVGLALLVVAMLVIERRWPRLDARQLALTALLGLVGLFAYNLFFLGAVSLIPASRTALVVALNPILTALGMAAVFRERIALHRWIGILLALAGVWIVLAHGEPARLLAHVGRGEWLMFGGAVTWAAYTILMRFVFAGPNAMSPLAATTVSTLWGALFLSAGMPGEWPAWHAADFTPAVLGATIYLGAGGTALAFVWYSQGVQRLGPSRAAVFNNMVPVFGVALGVLLLGEPLEPSMLAGGAIAIAGVSLTNFAGNQGPRARRA